MTMRRIIADFLMVTGCAFLIAAVAVAVVNTSAHAALAGIILVGTGWVTAGE